MKRKPIYLLVALLTLAGFLPGGLAGFSPPSVLAAAPQPPAVQWTKTFGGAYGAGGSSAQPTADGGYIVTGWTTQSYGYGDRDAYLVKTDASGNMTWQGTFGGIGDDVGNAVQQTADGGYIIAGSTNSSGAGGYDVYLVKIDVSGNMTWQKTFGGSGDDQGSSVQQTADGGYVIAGYTNSSSAGGYDVYLVKTDASGNMTWQKTFGGAGYDVGNSVLQTTDNGYIIIGATTSFSFGVGDLDVYLIKTEASGNMTWQKTFWGAGGPNEDRGYSVRTTADGGYIIAGSTWFFGFGMSDVFLIKTDSLGDTTWQKTFGEAGPDWGYSVQQTVDGGYIIAGETQSFGAGSYSDVYLVKTDAFGNLIWQKTFGGEYADMGYSVALTSDGGYIIAGFTNSFGADDVYLIKLGPEPVSLPGDANGDGVVDALDITKVERIIIGLDAPTPGADANQDGKTNALDITKVERIIAGLN